MAGVLERPAPVPMGLGRREEAAVVVFGTWMILGLFLDGWSHNHQRPETFFTPWHGVLYSGFGAAVLWSLLDGRRQARRPDVAPGAGLTGAPVDRLLIAGLAVFAISAVGDFGWHQAFGIERDVAALLSPTHLALMTGGLLMVTAPIRAEWHRPGDDRSWAALWPVIGSATLTLAVITFFLMYLSPFRSTVTAPQALAGPASSFLVQQAEIQGIASVLITNVLFIGVVLVLTRRWHLPLGTFAVVFGVVAVANAGLDSFHQLPLFLTVIPGGVAADLLFGRRTKPSSAATRARAAIVSVAVWLPYFVAFKLAYHLTWTIHLWLGTVLLAALTGVGLSLLAVPPVMPSDNSAAAVAHLPSGPATP